MSWMRALLRRRTLQNELDDELLLHVELQTKEFMASGMSPEEARAAARRRFGNLAGAQERCRDENRVSHVEAFWQDLRFGFRTLASQRGFSAAVLATLALGIGANTAMFSVLRAALFEPLPLPAPDRVVYVWENDRLRSSAREAASYPDYLDLKSQAQQFEHLAAIQPMDVTLTVFGQEAERVRAARVTSNYFGVLGLPPTIGRAFGPGEDGVVLSYGLWQRKFAGSTGVLGAQVSVDGYLRTILGVLPVGASIEPRAPEIWTSQESVRSNFFRGQHNTRILGRLKPGATVEQANTEVAGIMARLEREYPNDNLGRGAFVIPMHEFMAANLRPALRVIAAAVAGILLIACVNISSLLLSRAAARQHEMAVRTSLGARRGRLTRQLLTESLLLALLGGALGIAVAYGGVEALGSIAPPNTPLLGRARVDGLALAATLGLSVFAWILFGVVPAWRASSTTPGAALRSEGRTATGRESHRLLQGLVIAEIALAMVLVIAAGLLIRSFWRLGQVQLGYQPSGIVSLRYRLPEKTYPAPPRWPYRQWPAVAAFHQRLKESVQSLPNVQVAALAASSPAEQNWTTRVYPADKPAPPEGEMKEAQLLTADPAYLQVTRATLLRGRFFESGDDESHPMVAVVNETFLRDHFPAEDALGKRIVVFGMPREIVGIVGDIRYAGPSQPPAPTMYFPTRQQLFGDGALIVRTTGDPSSVIAALRKAVAQADPNVAAYDVVTLDQALAAAIARERFVLFLLTGFGALALALAVIGTYGVVAYTVGTRRREIAVRMAMGARPSDIFVQVTTRTILRAILGVAAGVGLAAMVAPLLQPLVFETNIHDLTTYGAVSAVLLIVAFVAAAIPAQRAASLDPVVTLRQE